MRKLHGILADLSDQDIRCVAEILNHTGNLLAEPGVWVKGHWALDKAGDSVHDRDSNAVRWCAVGGINKVTPPRIAPLRDRAVRVLANHISQDDAAKVPSWNDDQSRTQEQVVNAFRDAASSVLAYLAEREQCRPHASQR